MVLWEFDAGTSTNNNTMPDASLDEMAEWPGVKKKFISGQKGLDSNQDSVKIKGTWRPNTITRTATNDNEIQTWLPTTGLHPPPTYTEQLHLRFFRAPFFSTNGTARTSAVGVNVQVKLRYIVQFKDLKNQLRYPRTGDTPIVLDTLTDTLKEP